MLRTVTSRGQSLTPRHGECQCTDHPPSAAPRTPGRIEVRHKTPVLRRARRTSAPPAPIVRRPEQGSRDAITPATLGIHLVKRIRARIEMRRLRFGECPIEHRARVHQPMRQLMGKKPSKAVRRLGRVSEQEALRAPREAPKCVGRTDSTQRSIGIRPGKKIDISLHATKAIRDGRPRRRTRPVALNPRIDVQTDHATG